MPPIVDKSKITRICIDDFALRKRYTYGTVMIDWDTHRVIDMIPTRETKDVSEWLATYPNIKMISRDGSSGYSSAGTRAHPDAIQVTDRFHLIKNLSEIIDRYIRNTFPARVEIDTGAEIPEEMKCLYNTANRSQRIRYAQQKHEEGLTTQEIAYLLHTSTNTIGRYLAIPGDKIPEDHAIVRERQHKEAVGKKQLEVEYIRKLYADGMSVSDIARETHHTLKTVNNYLDPTYKPVNGHYDLKRRGKITEYEHDILQMRSKGKTYREIHQYIKEKGYTGTTAAIRVYMQKERAHARTSGGQGKEFVQRISLTRLLYKSIEEVKMITKSQYEAVLKQYPELAKLYDLLKEFNRILFSKKPDDLEQWLKQASTFSMIPELQSFVEGMRRDQNAVKNAILNNYNNGLAEGSVTKIKLIKRIMYGRNSFDLLKSKLLMHELLYVDIN